MLTSEQIRMHKNLKEKYASYPKLPKFILTGKMNSKKYGEGLKQSCLRGFLTRVANWNKAEEARWSEHLAKHRCFPVAE